MVYASHLVERHAAYTLTLYELHSWIADLRSIYEETRSEKALMLLNKFEARLQLTRTAEQTQVELDLGEILRNPGLYPHSVVTWAFGYSDN